jgi:hypothetical protein
MCLFEGTWGTIGNQTTLCSFGKEVGGLGDATAFTVLLGALSHVNMYDNDIRITLQYGFALIMHHHVS